MAEDSLHITLQRIVITTFQRSHLAFRQISSVSQCVVNVTHSPKPRRETQV